MDSIDFQLMDKAKSHFLVALATFGRQGDDPYDVVRTITQQAKTAGFSKRGRHRLLDYLYGFVDVLSRCGVDPLVHGAPAENPHLLFGPDQLGGLFDPRSGPASLASDEQPPDRQAEDRALIEQLIAATRLYATSAAVQDLLNFIIRMRAFAPFNGMLLHIQKPGLTHAATAADWQRRFGRLPRRGTRPMVVLRTMGPVDFVFDILDTEGQPLPEHAFTFPTLGALTEARFDEIAQWVAKSGIDLVRLDVGDAEAGWIRRLPVPNDSKVKQRYQLAFNRNHPAATRLVTIAHELAHLYLGHLGSDPARKIRERRDLTHAQREVESEMTAYIVAKRNGLTPRSESYLEAYKGAFIDLDLHAVMRASNEVEAAMGVSAHQLRAEVWGHAV